MVDLIIEPTAKTPHVRFLPQEDLFEIKGRCIPEDAAGYYARIIEYLQNYFAATDKPFVLKFHLEYFNTATSHRIYEILKMCEARHLAGKDCKVIWAYDSYNYDMEDTGKDYKLLCKFPFELLPIEEED